MFKEEYFKRTPKWKMFFIRLLGEKIISLDSQFCSISYKFMGKIYFDRIINGMVIYGEPAKTFAFSKACDPNKWE